MDVEKLNELKKKLKRDREQAYENNLVKKKTLKEKKGAAKKRKTNETKEDFQQVLEGDYRKEAVTNNNAASCEGQEVISCTKINIRKPKSNETEASQKLKTTKNGIDNKATFKDDNKVNTSFKIKINKKEQRRSKVQQKPVTKKKINSEQTIHQRREDVRKRVSKYREKMSEEQLIEKRRKDRERYRLKKEKGLIPDINKMSTKKKKQIRKKWKEASSSYRERKRTQQKTEYFLQENSPPVSDIEVDPNPDNVVGNDSVPCCSKKVNKTRDVVKNEEKQSDHKSTGRKKVRKDRASCYRKLKAAERKIADLKKSIERYRKRYKRQNFKFKILNNKIKENDTPETKINKLTSGVTVPPEVKRRLLFGEALSQQLSENAKKIITQKDKNIFSKVISGKVMKKYKLIGDAKQIISYKMHRKQTNKTDLSIYERKRRNSKIGIKLKRSVREFMERDEISKMCPGKKDYVIRSKIKKQKRILLNNFRKLHQQYLKTENSYKISFTTFWRHKPFWVVVPKLKDHETCACIKHENMRLIVERAFHSKLINVRRADDFLKEFVCEENNFNCMMGRCLTCKQKKIQFKNEIDHPNKNIVIRQWETKKEQRNIKGESKIIRRTVKEEKTLSIMELQNLLISKTTDYTKHVFYMRHQQRHLRLQKMNIKPNELILQIDFSENYVSKYTTEIQSVHFGASKRQISLHTGIYYYRQKTNSSIRSQCFCSVSDNLDHQSHAVWAHLDGILSELSRTFPDTYKVQFFSDGPTSQYKNRNNIYFFAKRLPEYFNNISEASWNFSESGHGKGPMDGVGGSLKRTADRLVLQGTDITSAQQFVQSLSDSSIKIWEVQSKSIEKFKTELPKNIPGIPNMMLVHQITWSRKSDPLLFLRCLSCFSCGFGQICSHYSLRPSEVSLLSRKNSILFLLIKTYNRPTIFKNIFLAFLNFFLNEIY